METKFLEVKVDPATGYESVGFKINDGAGSVAVIPYRKVEHSYEILVRRELTPGWQTRSDYEDPRNVVAITGLIEPGEQLRNAAARELMEETGYDRDIYDFILLWWGHQSKAMRDDHFIYAVDLTGLEPETAPGDGTTLEKVASNEWFPIDFIEHSSRATFDISLMLGVVMLRRMLDV